MWHTKQVPFPDGGLTESDPKIGTPNSCTHNWPNGGACRAKLFNRLAKKKIDTIT